MSRDIREQQQPKYSSDKRVLFRRAANVPAVEVSHDTKHPSQLQKYENRPNYNVEQRFTSGKSKYSWDIL